MRYGRKNYNKLIVQAGHFKGTGRMYYKRKPRSEKREEDLTGRLGMKVGSKSKYFRDHLQPLMRWLKTQIGRPWDSVLGDAKNLATSWGQEHIMGHIKNSVSHSAHHLKYATYGLYVDEFGVLRNRQRESRREKIEWRKRHSEAVDKSVIHNGVEYKRIDGKWYRVARHTVSVRSVAYLHDGSGRPERVVEKLTTLSASDVTRLKLQ